jgi:hypothetical protein
MPQVDGKKNVTLLTFDKKMGMGLIPEDAEVVKTESDLQEVVDAARIMWNLMCVTEGNLVYDYYDGNLKDTPLGKSMQKFGGLLQILSTVY